MQIFSLGFRQSHLASLADLDAIGQIRRIVFDGGTAFRVHDGQTESLAHLAGRVPERPAVGDFVLVDDATITEIVPRSNAVRRRAAGSDHTSQALAANVDRVLIVEPLHPAPNLRRIERGVTVATSCHALAVVVLTKRDLVASADDALDAVSALNPMGEVVAVAALDAEGVAPLWPHLPTQETALLIGASGAGKSTLLNALLGDDRLATGGVRAGDAKGRHTTTARTLLRLEQGALVIDTPGTRELGLWADADAIEQSFVDVSLLSEGCRYRDCAHQDEPGCAVHQAIEDGAIDQARLNSFHKQMREARHLEEKSHDHLRRAREKRFAKVVAEATERRRQK